LLKNNQIKISDFGSAIDLKLSSVNPNGFAGTEAYASPEMLNFKEELFFREFNLEKEAITFKTDIW
jgi:serine/threonine protein kinase